MDANFFLINLFQLLLNKLANRIVLLEKTLTNSIIDFYLALCDLFDFAEMNWNGFNRLINKYEGIARDTISAVALRHNLESFPLKKTEDVGKSVNTCENLWFRTSS